MSANDRAPTRRDLVTISAAALLALSLPTIAIAASRGVRAVRVDTGPLAAKGVRNYAARVAAAGQPILERAFAGLMTSDRSAPTAVLQIASITLTSNPGGGRHFLDVETDSMDGAGLLVGAGGAVISREPLNVSNAPSGGPTIDLLADEDRRMRQLIAQMAYWFARSLG